MKIDMIHYVILAMKADLSSIWGWRIKHAA